MEIWIHNLTWESAVNIGTLLTAVIAVVSLLFGIRVYRRQMNAQLFLEYTRRYEQIFEGFPDPARSMRLDQSGEPPEESSDLTEAVLRYLNLCSEEYYLRKRGYLDKDIWLIWEGELKRTLKSPLLRREWPKLRSEFSAYSEFSEFVRGVQSSPDRVLIS